MAGEIELKGTLRIKSKTAAAWSAANPELLTNPHTKLIPER